MLFRSQKKAGLEPVFNPRALGIRNADFWDKRPEPAGTDEAPTGELAPPLRPATR